MRAKRRGPAGGGGESKPSAFGGLSSKLTAPPATTGAFSFSTNKKGEFFLIIQKLLRRRLF